MALLPGMSWGQRSGTINIRVAGVGLGTRLMDLYEFLENVNYNHLYTIPVAVPV